MKPPVDRCVHCLGAGRVGQVSVEDVPGLCFPGVHVLRAGGAGGWVTTEAPSMPPVSVALTRRSNSAPIAQVAGPADAVEATTTSLVEAEWVVPIMCFPFVLSW